MIPKEWAFQPLTELAYSIQNGFVGKVSEYYIENGIPYLMSKNIRENRIEIKDLETVSEEFYKKNPKSVVKTGDILTVQSGHIGTSAKVIPALNNSCCHALIITRPIIEKIDSDFIAYYLNSPLGRKRLSDIFIGTTIKHINTKDLKKFFVPVPPLPEQKKIAAILSSVDEAMAFTQAVIDQTRKVKQGLLQQLLTHGIGHTKFKDSAIGKIPESWNVAQLREVSNIVRGSTPRPAKDPRYFNGDYIAWITVSEISKDDFPYLFKTEFFLTEEGKKQSRLIPKGTVILKNSGYGLGVPKILALDGCANDGIAAFLELDNKIAPEFLYYFLYSMTNQFRRAIARGVDQPNLNTELIGAVQIPIPTLEEQQAIAEMLFNCDKITSENEKTVTNYLELKRGLMQDLLTGRVRVKGA